MYCVCVYIRTYVYTVNVCMSCVFRLAYVRIPYMCTYSSVHTVRTYVCGAVTVCVDFCISFNCVGGSAKWVPITYPQFPSETYE